MRESNSPGYGSEQLRRADDALRAASGAPISPAEVPSQTELAGHEVPQFIGPYRVIRMIGKGGMGAVWVAHDSVLDRQVAIKVLANARLPDSSTVRLLREAKAAARLNHPNTVSIYHVHEQNERVNIVMELLGPSLADELKSRGALSWPQATSAIRDAAAGLAAAHAAGLVHRDVKPSNLLRSPASGAVKVADFGLVQCADGSTSDLTAVGAVVGTPTYMSPEQCQGAAADARSDVYSLACTFYELLTNERAFDGASPLHIMHRHCAEELPDIKSKVSDIPNSICRVLARATEKRPERRYQDASEMLSDLKSILNRATHEVEHSELKEALTDDALRIVLIYKRNAQPDAQVLSYLETRLKGLGHNVFIDRHLTIGVEWAREIEQRIRDADAVVPLLSAASIHSEMLSYELQVAHGIASHGTGKPRILPLRIQYSGTLPPELASVVQPLHYFLWSGPADNDQLVEHLRLALAAPKRLPVRGDKLEAVGGAVPLDSKFYVVRRTDQEFAESIGRHDATVLIKGARQTGKTSLLARGLRHARDAGMTAIITDFQKLTAAELESPKAFYLALGELLADQLELSAHPGDAWNEKRAPNINFERFLRREVLDIVAAPLIWALDEVDRLFGCSFGSEVFALFRTWHNERALDPSGPWSKLTLAIAYATEAHLFITDVNQSPFNVGTRLVLQDFTVEQVTELNDRYGSPLSRGAEVAQLYRLVGGHPFLVQRGLFEMTTQGATVNDFQARADQEDGPYGDHLRRILVMLAKDPLLLDVMRGVLRGQPCPTAESFYRLRSAGIISGVSAHHPELRCVLYESYLKRHLF